MEYKGKGRDNEEDIECLDTPDHLKYLHNLAKTKAVKLKLKCHLEKAVVRRVPKVIHFGNDVNDDKSKDTVNNSCWEYRWWT
jgi:hypothetical protein